MPKCDGNIFLMDQPILLAVAFKHQIILENKRFLT